MIHWFGAEFHTCFSLRCNRPTLRPDHWYSPSTNLCTKARSDFSRVTRIYESVSDRRLSYVLHDWSMIGVCVTVGPRHGRTLTSVESSDRAVLT